MNKVTYCINNLQALYFKIFIIWFNKYFKCINYFYRNFKEIFKETFIAIVFIE